MSEELVNLFETTLSAAITTTGQTSMTLAATTGPGGAIGTAGTWRFVLGRASTTPEIVMGTARVGSAVSIARGQESTTAQTWPIGTTVTLALTKSALLAAINEARYGDVNLHHPRYGTPTDGTSDCTSIIATALADVPVGGRLLFGPYIYSVSTIDLSSRPDVTLQGHGGFRNVDTTYGTVLRPRSNSVPIVDCSPSALVQYGPEIRNIGIVNIDVKTGITGFYFVGVNGWAVKRCGAKYITGPAMYAGYDFAYGPGSDMAWMNVDGFWAYQCTTGVKLESVLNFNARQLNFDVVDGTDGVLLTGYSQNVYMSQLSVDGQNASGVAKGTALHVDTGGAHNVHVTGYKFEACQRGAYLQQNPSGPGTGWISFSQGVVAGVNEGSPNGIGFEMEAGVHNVIVQMTRVQDPTDAASVFIDPNSPSSNRFVTMDPPALANAPASLTVVSTYLLDAGLRGKN